MEVAAVLKSLVQLSQQKPLSFREKKMLERARYLLVSELAMARNWEEGDVEEELRRALAKCKLRFPEASVSRSLSPAFRAFTPKQSSCGHSLRETWLGPPESKLDMTGTLHIFRRRIAKGGDIYQVNLTSAGSTFAKVFARAKELDEFLLVGLDCSLGGNGNPSGTALTAQGIRFSTRLTCESAGRRPPPRHDPRGVDF